MAHERVIGLDGNMPWHLPADLAWFKQNTLGKPIVMGRKTWDSIGRALPGRRNLVISRDECFAPAGAERVSSPDAAISLLADVPEIMIVGGAQIYRHFLPNAERLYLTLIDTNVPGDTFFPDYTVEAKWREVSRTEHPVDTKNPHPHTFLILDRES